MRRLTLFLFLLGAVFMGAYSFAKWEEKSFSSYFLPPSSQKTLSFLPSPYPLKNHPFTVVLIGANNGATIEKTLSSLFSQNYEPFRLIYIDDASDDGSFDLARDLIYESNHLTQVTLVHNETRLGVLANLFRAVQSCSDEEIIVVLNGEDWLAHEWVLQKLNSYYANPDLWLTFGQYCDFPTYQPGICQNYKNSHYRQEPFLASHLKTFYAGLFKKIRESDLIQQGRFIAASSEMAYMIPMLEMASNHFQFISDILYIHNRQAHFKEDRELQLRCEKFIRALDPYPPLEGMAWRD